MADHRAAGAVVYITIASIQSANPPWVPGKMHILSYFAVTGMALGYLVVQLRRVPEASPILSPSPWRRFRLSANGDGGVPAKPA